MSGRITHFVLAVCLTTNVCWAADPEPVVSPAPQEPRLVIDSRGHSGQVKEVLFSDEGRTLISLGDDKTIRFWDVGTGELLKTLWVPSAPGREGKLYAGALSPDERWLAVTGWTTAGKPNGHSIYLIDLRTSRLAATLPGHTDVIHALAFSPDGTWLASGSGDDFVRIWKREDSGELVPSQTLSGHSDDVYAVAFSPDGEKLVSASFDDTLRLWNRSADGLFSLAKILAEHTDKVQTVAFSPDGRYIVSGGWDHRLLLWNEDGDYLREIARASDLIVTISFSADSSKVVASGYLGGQLTRVYQIPSGERLSTFPHHSNSVLASAYHGKGLVATAGGDDQDIYLWEPESGEVKQHLLGQGRTVWAIAFEASDLEVAFGNLGDESKVLLDEPLHSSFDFSGLTMTPELSGSDQFQRTQLHHRGHGFEKISATELRIEDGGTITTSVSTDRIIAWSYTPAGEVVVGSHFALKLYDPDGSFIREFIGHHGTVWALSISRDGRLLASASWDQTVKLWNLATGDLLATLFVARDGEWICWTPQGYYEASASGESYLGWLIDHGPDQLAEFLPAYAYNRRFHQPELVRRTVELGSFELAYAESGEARPGSPSAIPGITDIVPPRVVWSTPLEMRSETRTSRFAVRASVLSPSPLHEVQVRVDGRPVFTTTRERGLDGTTFDLDREINLTAGDRVVSIFARNRTSSTMSDPRLVNYVARSIPQVPDWQKPDLYVVSIGISDYQFGEDEIDLEFADDDAHSIGDLYRRQAGGLFHRVEVRELVNERATQDAILEALEWLETNATHKDTAILFVSGHGLKDHRDDYYLLPHDGDPDKLLRTAVSSSTIAITLGGIPAKVLIFLDTCHSGKLGQNISERRTKSPGEWTDHTEAIRELTSQEYGLGVIAASTGREKSIEADKWGHGAFTFALIEALESGHADLNKNGIVHLHELKPYLAERVKQLTKGAQHPTVHDPSTISRFPIFQVE